MNFPVEKLTRLATPSLDSPLRIMAHIPQGIPWALVLDLRRELLSTEIDQLANELVKFRCRRICIHGSQAETLENRIDDADIMAVVQAHKSGIEHEILVTMTIPENEVELWIELSTLDPEFEKVLVISIT